MRTRRPKYSVANRLFVDDHVDITDTAVRRCHFDGCIVRLDAKGSVIFNHVNFSDCQLVGDGWCPELLAKIGYTKGPR